MTMRPQLHLTPRTGWMNDPHAITWHDGRYHVFYQYVPDRLTWGSNCHWAHVTSPDLLGDWHDEGVALAPGDGDDGIWTGSLVIGDDGRARIFYTSVVEPNLGIGRVRTAVPADDGWTQWRKGPVVVEAPSDLDLVAFRDPFVQRDGDGWRMHVGAGTTDGTALALTWTSSDLDHWRYAGIALQRSTQERDPVWTGALWECPQLIEVDGHAVMVSSVWSDDVLYYAGYAIGSFEGTRLVAHGWGQVSFGDSYYAPSFFRDREGRPCLTFWMRGVRDEEAGWASCHSIPYLLSVRNDRLWLEPHPNVTDRIPDQPADSASGVLVAALRWQTAQGRLQIETTGTAVAEIEVTDSVLVLRRRGAADQVMPIEDSEFLLVLDGPVLEICASGRVIGGAIEPASAVRDASGQLVAGAVGTQPRLATLG